MINKFYGSFAVPTSVLSSVLSLVLFSTTLQAQENIYKLDLHLAAANFESIYPPEPDTNYNSGYSGFGFFSSDSSSSSYDDNTPQMRENIVVDTSTNINIAANAGGTINYDHHNDNDENLADLNHLLATREEKTKFAKNDPYYGKDLCGNGEYTCIKLKKKDTWKSLFPDDYQRELVQRINRMSSGLWNRSWILVPNNLNKDYLQYSPLPLTRSDLGGKTVVVDQKELAFGAYNENGELVHWGPVNPGKAGTRTSLGDNFKIYRKGGAGCWSKKFDANMPYCMFFNGGFAMHGFNMPGFPASHGCVRMYNSDAKWLNKEFTEYGTRVIVTEL